MPICPQGHDSPTADYCDYCGWPMSAPGQQVQQQPQQSQQPYQQHPPSTAGLVMCPICATPQTERYCEECGYDYDLASPSRRMSTQAGPQAPPPPPPASPYPAPGYPSQGQPQGQPQRGGPPPAPDYSRPQQQSPQQQPPQPYSMQPHPSAGPMSPYSYQAPQAEPQQEQEQEQERQPSPPYGVPAGSFGGVSYSTGDTGGGFDTDFRLQPPSNDPSQGYAQPQPPAGRGTWVAVVGADREYFDDMMARSGPDAAGLYFPPYSPERRVPMTGRGQLRIGRRSHQRGTVPEIDLSIAPEDPGASHQHALLQEQPDGSWVVIDQDSTNGTTINGAPDTIAAHTAIPLKDGDRIHVGAWTTVTVHRS